MSGPVDVMRHKLVSRRRISREGLRHSRFPDDYRARIIGSMAHDAGMTIFERYRPKYVDELSDDTAEVVESQLFVFSPEELAAFVADVRERAIHEVLTLADNLTTETEEVPDVRQE